MMPRATGISLLLVLLPQIAALAAEQPGPRACEEMGTGSEPDWNMPQKRTFREVPVPNGTVGTLVSAMIAQSGL
jgi:hypothetical protein